MNYQVYFSIKLREYDVRKTRLAANELDVFLTKKAAKTEAQRRNAEENPTTVYKPDNDE